jgi:hypothetical protein
MAGLLLGVIGLARAAKADPAFSVSADRLSARPGDTITFRIVQDLKGTPLDRREFTLDGYRIDWELGEHPWKATPGTHVLRLYLRWIDDQGDRVHRQQYVVVQVSDSEKKGGYKHPGLSLSGDELDVIKARLRAPEPHPMKGIRQALMVSLDYRPHALKDVDMKDADEKRGWDRDGSMLRKLALKWALEDDEKAAGKAVKIMMDWANTCEQLMMEDVDAYQFLHVTNIIDGWLEGAEILKHYHGGYKGWSAAEREKFDRQYVRKHLVPLSLAWQGNIGNPYATQNQPLNVAKARIMLGIYLDDESLFQDGCDHLMKARLHGGGYSKIFGRNPISLMELSIGPNGEYMEINRDRGHMGMCVATTQKCAEILWHQDVDLYGMKFHEDEKPRILLGLEWLTRAAYGGERATRIGDVSIRPGKIGNYEMMYNHYHHRLKDRYPLSKEFTDHVMRSRRDGVWWLSTLTHTDLSASH